MGDRRCRSRRRARSPRRRGRRSGPARRPSRASPGGAGTRRAGSRTSRRQYASSSRVSARWVCRRTPCSRASSAVRRIRSSVTEKGEQGASAMRVMARGRGSWYSRISRQRVGQDRLLVLAPRRRGAGRPGSAPAHRAARGMEADAQLARGRDLDVDEPLLAAREQVQVVGGGGAAGEQQLAQAHARGRVHRRPRRCPRQTSYSSVSQRKSGASCTRGTLRVRVCGRWWCVFTRPGSTTLPRASMRRSILAAPGTVPEPTCSMRSSSTSTQPSGRRVRASSMQATSRASWIRVRMSSGAGRAILTRRRGAADRVD